MASLPESLESDAVFPSDTMFPPLHEEVVNTITHGIGWLVVLAAKPILTTFPWHVLAWIGGGGFFYTAGVYFVAADRRFYHSIWHLFVLAGSACHFLAVMHYLEFRAV